MRTSTELLAREGWLPLATALFLFALFVWIDAELLALGGFLLTLGVLLFFRNPERIAEEESPSVLLAPLDGRIEEIEAEGKETRIVIANRTFDTHLLRSPLQGVLEKSAPVRGLFLPEYSPLADRLNERYRAVFRTENGRSVAFGFRSGGCPYPATLYRGEQHPLRCGDRIGFLAGGKATLILPEGNDVRIAVGDTVRSGETILAYLR